MSHRTWLKVVALGLVIGGCGGKSTSGVKDETNQLGVKITAPNGNVSILAGTSIDLRARFSDGPGEVTPDTLSWTSSVAGQWMPSTNPGAVALQTATHTITANGTFGGKSGSDSVTVTVSSMAVSIDHPGNLAHVGVGDTVQFQATALEGPDVLNPITLVSSATPGPGERNALFTWNSSMDGDFATGDTVSYAALRAGEHTITLTVTDSTNAAAPLVGKASIKLVVNTPPVATIVSPDCTNGIALAAGASQAFVGNAADAQDGPLTGSWADNLTGGTSAGNNLSFQSNVLGRHDLVFSATDSLGDEGTAMCHVTVYPAGGTAADLFPSTTAINAALANGSHEIHFIGNDGAGNTFVGNQDGLTVFDSSFAPIGTSYDGTQLGFTGTPTIYGAVVSGGTIVVATGAGLTSCAYAAGVLSSCAALPDGLGAYRGIAVTGDLSGTATLASAGLFGTLYVASYAAGVPTHHVYLRNDILGADIVQDVAFAGGALYVATSSGVCVINDPAAAAANPPATLCSKTITHDSSILPSDSVTSFALTGDSLWMGTTGGIVRYQVTGGGMSVYNRGDGLVSNTVNDLAVDAAGIVWVATTNGVSRFDPATATFTSLHAADWAPQGGGSNTVRAIYIDGSGAKWFGTDAGVVKYIGA